MSLLEDIRVFLDIPVGEDGDTFLREIPSRMKRNEDSTNCSEGILGNQVLVDIMLEKLSDRERENHMLRFDLADGDEMNLDKEGEHIGITRERVCQIGAKSPWKLHISAYQRLKDAV